MKKLVFSLIAISAMVLTGCQCGKDHLSLRKAQQLYDQEIAKDQSLIQSQEIVIGYYELNDEDARTTLRQLAANNIITYSCERLAKPTPWGKEIAHFVTIALTTEGESLIVKEQKTQDQIDLEWTAKSHDEYPEAMVAKIEFPDEHQTKQVKEEVKHVEPAALDSLFVMVDSSKAINIDTMAIYLYDQASKKTHTETVKLFCGQIKSIKARNAQTYPIDSCNAMAYAEIVYKLTNVSPVGRICKDLEEGRKGWVPVAYLYNKNTGWMILNDENLKEFNIQYQETLPVLDDNQSRSSKLLNTVQNAITQRVSEKMQLALAQSADNKPVNYVAPAEECTNRAQDPDDAELGYGLDMVVEEPYEEVCDSTANYYDEIEVAEEAIEYYEE